MQQGRERLQSFQLKNILASLQRHSHTQVNDLAIFKQGPLMHFLTFLSFIFIFLNSISLLEALPSQILIIRAAERPLQGDSLSLRGRERAAALAPMITESPEFIVFGQPFAIYAAGASKSDPSKRPVETVKPLADSLKIPIIDKYTNQDYRKMIEEIQFESLYNGKTIVICWEQPLISEIARAFGALQTPARWPVDIFDRIWSITYSPTQKAQFQSLPQRLLYGDSTN